MYERTPVVVWDFYAHFKFFSGKKSAIRVFATLITLNLEGLRFFQLIDKFVIKG